PRPDRDAAPERGRPVPSCSMRPPAQEDPDDAEPQTDHQREKQSAPRSGRDGAGGNGRTVDDPRRVADIDAGHHPLLDLLQQKRAHRFADFDILLLPQTLREEADIALRPLPPRLPQKSIGAFMHPEQEVAREDWIRVTQADSVDARRVRMG